MGREVDVECTEKFEPWLHRLTEGKQDQKGLLEPDRGLSRRR